MGKRTEFIALMQRLAPNQGMTPIAGGILAVLLYDGSELSFGELAEELQVSRGSISTNTRMLIGCHIIERIRRPGDRQDYFRITGDLHRGLLTETVRSMTATAGAIRDLAHTMPPAADPRLRIEGYAQLYEDMTEAMTQVIQRRSG